MRGVKCNAMPLFFVYETCYMRLLWLNLLRCIGMLTLLRRWLFSIDLLDTPKCGVDILNIFNGLVKVKKKIDKSVQSLGAVKTRGANHTAACVQTGWQLSLPSEVKLLPLAPRMCKKWCSNSLLEPVIVHQVLRRLKNKKKYIYISDKQHVKRRHGLLLSY